MADKVTTQNVINTTSNIGAAQQPYYNSLMQGAQGLLSTGMPIYQGGNRLEGFTQQQKNLQNQIGNMQTPGQFGQATNFLNTAAQGTLANAQYNPSQFGAQQIGMPNLQNFQMSGPGNVFSRDIRSRNMQSAQSGFNPNIQAFQFGGARDVGAQDVYSQNMQAAQSGYRPDLEAFQMGPTERVSGADVNAPTMEAARTSFGQGPLEQFRMQAPEQFGGVQASQYMSPFQQNVTDIQKREAVRDAQKGQLVQDLGAARQGTYGGSRQLLAGLERERNLGTQLGDIQARGSQAAFENAQAQFERDRTAGMTAGRENLGASLQQQQLGVNTGMQAALANLSNEQQANVNNQATRFQAQGMNADSAMKAALANQQAGLTTGQQNLQSRMQTQELGAQQNLQTAMQNLSNEQQSRVNNQAQQFQAQGMNQEQAMRAALANQGVDVTRAQANQQAQLQTQQLGTETGRQMALANLSNEQQARVNNQAQQFQAQGMNQEQAMRAALSNQQSDLTRGQANLTAALDTQRLGAQTGLAALQSNQQADLDRQRMAEQSRQFGAGQGLAAFGQLGQFGQTMTNLGSANQQADLARLGLQTSTAAQEQAFGQQQRDLDYQDFVKESDYPYMQYQRYANLMSGVPQAMSTTRTESAPTPGIAQQLLGAGLGAAGIYNTFKG